MVRRVKAPAPGNDRDYIPEAEGNRDDPDPVTVRLRTATELNKRSYYDTFKIEFDANGKPDIVDSGDEPINTLELFRRCVMSVKNYTDASGNPITNGVELATHGEGMFVYEVRGEILAAFSLSEKEKKTSDVPQLSSPEAPGNSAGIVGSADQKDSTPSVDAAPEQSPHPES